MCGRDEGVKGVMVRVNEGREEEEKRGGDCVREGGKRREGRKEELLWYRVRD